MTTLVFSIGPVQGFIAQSRRTADGWVGSYLLSYLAGNAIKQWDGKAKHGIEMVEPDVTGVGMYDAIKGVPPSSDPTIAALPNTIVLRVPRGQEPTVAEEGKRAAEKAWEDVKEAIWHALPAPMTKPYPSEVWGRQVKAPWEFNWAWGADSKEAYNNLAARKGLRNFAPLREEGDRCTVCAEREALWDKGTYNRARHHQARDAARENWSAWVQQINGIYGAPKTLIRLDGKERLCALCLIKRLIPWWGNPIKQLWKEAKAGTALPSVFPSTSTMATVLYRAELVDAACKPANAALRAAVDGYYDKIKSLDDPADPLNRFPRWVAASTKAKNAGWESPEKFLRFDGDWYLYGEAVKNELNLSDATHRDLVESHRRMCDDAAQVDGVGHPPIYYALLTMDGDNMGDFIGAVHKAGKSTKEVSRLLNQFAAQVPRIVHDDTHNGRVIYAGGDDVLALLPLETALPTADALRRKYKELFDQWINSQKLEGSLEIKTSLSGSIVFAHHQAPLAAVLRAGHTLLKDWAKKKIVGKNAVGLQQFQRGGAAVTLAVPWEQDGSPFADRMFGLLKKLSDKQMASRLLYGLQEESWLWAPGGPLTGQPADQEEFIASILEKSRLGEHAASKAERRRLALALARELLALCRGAVGEGPRSEFAMEPLLIARFLAGGGREER